MTSSSSSPSSSSSSSSPSPSKSAPASTRPSAQRNNQYESSSSSRYPLPTSLRDLRTDSNPNFDFLLQQRTSVLDEERIQRIIEDKMLQPSARNSLKANTAISSSSSSSASSSAAPPASSYSVSAPSSSAAAVTSTKPAPPTALPPSLPQALPSSLEATSSSAFTLEDLIPFIQHGFDTIVQDDFSRCFQSDRSPAWNWNLYLYPLWCGGVVIRYLILFPLRLSSLVLGFLLWIILLSFIKLLVKNKSKRNEYERLGIKLLCSCFVFSWTGVIRYHGRITARRPHQIYVANHTSLIDIIILQQMNTFSMVGQRQKGFVGFMQNHVLDCLNNCFFDRAEANDRAAAAKKIKAHIADPTSNRLLIFPEGTCVNNEYCVQFKQGAFDMDAEVIPIAIKYNKIFVDAFWNSRAQSFPMHLLTLMTSWAVVCDVWYMHPQRQLPNETPIEFSERVKKMICERAGLKNVNWDGYLKHFRPSQRYIKEQQRRVSQSILAKWRLIQQSNALKNDDGEEEEELEQSQPHSSKNRKHQFEETEKKDEPEAEIHEEDENKQEHHLDSKLSRRVTRSRSRIR